MEIFQFLNPPWPIFPWKMKIKIYKIKCTPINFIQGRLSPTAKWITTTIELWFSHRLTAQEIAQKKTASSAPTTQSWTDNRKKENHPRKKSEISNKNLVPGNHLPNWYLGQSWPDASCLQFLWEEVLNLSGGGWSCQDGGRCQVSSKWLTSSWSFFFCFAHFVALGLKAAKEQLCWEKKIMWI